MTDNHVLELSRHCEMTATESISTCNESHIPVNIDGRTEHDFVVVGKKRIPKLNWTRLNEKSIDGDNRRLLEHRVKDCQCVVCYREINKLPPDEPLREKYIARKQKLEQRAIRKVKRLAKVEVKAGKQASIRNFFRY
jgi:hypothetical protein